MNVVNVMNITDLLVNTQDQMCNIIVWESHCGAQNGF